MSNERLIRRVRRVGAVAVVVSVAGSVVPSQAAAYDPPPGYGYELVTPVNTQGQRTGPIGMSDDGGRVLFSSSGGFAGTENLPDLGAQYVANRTPTGWHTSPLSPPASDYPFIGYGAVDFSRDLDSSVWWVNAKADKGTFNFTPIVRKPDGSFVVSGPTLNDGTMTPAVVGTSSDLSRLVLSSRARPSLTDGTTDTRSVARTSLILAQREDDGTVEVRQVGYRAGATMFPSCETRLGGILTSANTSALGSVSADGSKVFFTFAGTVSSCRTPAMQRVWMKSGSSDAVDISASQCTVSCGVQARAAFEGAARDGSRVFFSTEEKLLDGDQDASNKNDLYEYDFNATGNKLRTVTGSTDASGAGFVRLVRLSEDGSRAYFVANGRPLAGPNTRGQAPQPGDNNLYVYDRQPGEANGSFSFVAALDPSDSRLWGSDDARPVQLSSTGRYAIFLSAGDLVDDRLPGDTHPDLFRYDANTDELRRIWTADPAHNGVSRTAGPFIGGASAGPIDGGKQRTWTTLRPQLSDDGSKVAFDTHEQISPADATSALDAYLWRAETGQLSMLTDGQSLLPTSGAFVSMTPSGDSMLVNTSSALAKEHTSGAEATFVIRKGGGFPDPPAPVPSCMGDVCQGSIVGLPPLRGDGYVPSGGGNVTEVDAPAPRVAVKIPRSVRGTRVTATVRVSGAGRVTVSGSRIGRRTVSVEKAGSSRVALRLSADAAKRWREGKSVRVKIRVAFRPKVGRTVSRTATVTFKQQATGKRHGVRVEGMKGGR